MVRQAHHEWKAGLCKKSIARIELRQNKANYNLAHLVVLAKEWGVNVKELLPTLEKI
jgi:hypothetical protein